jgi:hypothetical protein
MARTLQQEKVTLVIRQDLMDQAVTEGEASGLNTAELIRRAIDLYLTQFPVPAQYETGDRLPAGDEAEPIRVKKLPIHINTGLLGELDRYALQLHQTPDEVANRSIILYVASLLARRQAAEEYVDPTGEYDPAAYEVSPEEQAALDEEPIPDDVIAAHSNGELDEYGNPVGTVYGEEGDIVEEGAQEGVEGQETYEGEYTDDGQPPAP